MIINVRGTHGSGKTTVVRKTLDLYSSRKPQLVPGRKRPYSYICMEKGFKPLFVPGHYETPTGGCDTINGPTLIYDAVRTGVDAGLEVVFEGIVAQHSTTRMIELAKEHDSVVVVLTTSLEECIESIRERRRAAGRDNASEKFVVTTTKEFKSVLSSTKRLKSEGVRVMELNRSEAFGFIREHLANEHELIADDAVVEDA